MKPLCSRKRCVIMAISAVLSITVVSGCEDTPTKGVGKLNALADREGVENGHYYSVPNAKMPAGVESIKPGMTRVDVLSILVPSYRRIDLGYETQITPIVDYFTYTEDGMTKYIEVHYSRAVVLFVVYGHGKTLPIL